jgi:hypothetical protein
MLDDLVRAAASRGASLELLALQRRPGRVIARIGDLSALGRTPNDALAALQAALAATTPTGASHA